MPKISAGILAFRYKPNLQVLLVHPGGPFWRNKDNGAWSIPKGEYDENENPLEAAKREFFEETGNDLPKVKFKLLQPVKLKSGKIIRAWAVNADFDPPFILSNIFEIEWPPKSGKMQSFNEVDQADWFSISDAKSKINPAQIAFLEEIEKIK